MTADRSDSRAIRPAGDETGLGPRRTALIEASVAVALADWDLLADVVDRAETRSVPEEMEEALLQTYLFLGYPRALTALSIWRERSGRPVPVPSDDDPVVWSERGARVCRDVYGTAYGPLRERVRSIHPDLERWMIHEGYGKVLGRPGLALIDRELAIAASLIGLGAPRQLHSHLRGALSVGARVEIVSDMVTRVCRLVDPDRSTLARSVWDDVQKRWRETMENSGPSDPGSATAGSVGEEA